MVKPTQGTFIVVVVLFSDTFIVSIPMVGLMSAKSLSFPGTLVHCPNSFCHERCPVDFFYYGFIEQKRTMWSTGINTPKALCSFTTSPISIKQLAGIVCIPMIPQAQYPTNNNEYAKDRHLTHYSFQHECIGSYSNSMMQWHFILMKS